MAVVGIGTVVVTIRFDQLIASSKDPISSFWISLFCSVVGGLVLGLAAWPFVALDEAFFIGLATMALAIFNGFYYLRVSGDQPLRASGGKAVQAGGVLGSQVYLGGAGWGSAGLLWGELAGRLIALSFIIRKVEVRGLPELKNELLEQWPAAKWLAPGAFLGALALQLLPLGMAVSVGAAAAGVFLLIYRMIVIPNSLLSKVASDTLLVEFNRLEQAGLPISEAVERSLGKLVLAGCCLYGSLAIYGKWVFPAVLGQQWAASADLIPWLSLLVGAWSLASPLAMVFVSKKKTRWSFGLSCLDIINRCTALALGFLFQDVLMSAMALAIGGVLVYGATVSCALRLAGASFTRAMRQVLFPGIFILFFLVGGAVWAAHELWVASICFSMMAFGLGGKKVLYG
ncbi:oligosaccharide flippase family protein [Marinobacter daepoensis]|uniref:oligosaccharide flippase family protein n=1 Tax=Marinobacter daepoensis TaxID=262077 RepID=UPI001C97DA62|nr:oligosaccharide flippase family protein [Marinobacter daepoensis]MBY6033631.1 oligosaccharide flippase family protein [Marinobacter daepoensis]